MLFRSPQNPKTPKPHITKSVRAVIITKMKTKVLIDKLRIKKGEELIAESPRQDAESLDLNSSITTKAPLLA